MNFEVKYRNKQGEVEVLVLDVASKSEVWPILKERGISAISVVESSGKRRKPAAKKPTGAKGAPSPLRGIVAGLLFVVCAGAGLWYFFSEKPTPQPAPTPEPKPAKIREIVPEPVVEPPVTNVAPVKEELPPLKPGERRNVKWVKPANWDQMTPAQRTRAQPVGRVIRPKWMDEKKLFTRITDQKIHRLLRVKPGQLFLGTATYDERFVASFLDSLKEPIIFEKDDTEQERAMKQAVIDTRKELKEAYDRGEDIAALMRETEKQMHEQAAYRLQLRQAVVKYKQSGEHTDQDVKDYISAANSILQEHGMEPLKLGNFWYHKAQLDSQTQE